MAQIVIDLTAQQASRLAVAYGKQFGLTDGAGAPRDATLADIKVHCIRELRAIVQLQERRIAEAAIADSPFDPT